MRFSPFMHTLVPTELPQEAEKIARRDQQALLQQRKLVLILDLDQTLIHATTALYVENWLQEPNPPQVRSGAVCVFVSRRRRIHVAKHTRRSWRWGWFELKKADVRTAPWSIIMVRMIIRQLRIAKYARHRGEWWKAKGRKWGEVSSRPF